MFGKKRREQQRADAEAISGFEGCPHKDVEENPSAIASGNPIDFSNAWGFVSASLNPGLRYPRNVRVDCPAGSYEVVGTGTKEEVRTKAAIDMGRNVCKNCPMLGSKED
ncbi:hypothetical protein EOL96_08435 [Candidatus Saccharibacteria bacterium]|nr:hypothetical protein [Candidatus Saccharibacteria bacterium]